MEGVYTMHVPSMSPGTLPLENLPVASPPVKSCPYGGKLALDRLREPVVVVAGINDRVAEHEHGRDLTFSRARCSIGSCWEKRYQEQQQVDEQ